MPSSVATSETEIKLPVGEAREARRMLKRAGFRLTRRRVFEENTLFDTPDHTLRAARLVLRVRQSGRRALLTFKGPAARSRHKSREELEVKIGDAVRVATILEHLGFAPSFRYEKYRAEYEHDGGLAMLDETPAGVYIELEGAPEWIDRQAAALGFRPAEYITASYASLWIEHRRTHPSAPEHMVFPR